MDEFNTWNNQWGPGAIAPGIYPKHHQLKDLSTVNVFRAISSEAAREKF